MHSEFYLIFFERCIQITLLDNFTDTLMFIYFIIRAGEEGAFFVNLYFICLLIIFYDINLDLQSNNNVFGTNLLI